MGYSPSTRAFPSILVAILLLLITARLYEKGVRTNRPYSFCFSAGKPCFKEGIPCGCLFLWSG